MNKKTQKPKIIRGCWQLASGHSQQNVDMQPILDAIECGFDTFDCADIYLGVEKLLGIASKISEKKLRLHTKFVPDLGLLPNIDRHYIESIIDRSRKCLQMDCIDLVQFHWWDWEIKNYFQTMEILFELKSQGKIAEIGLTNVNKDYLEEFATRFDIASVQTQVSLFDKRVERGIGEVCRKKNIKIFAYGSLLGGFLNEKWLSKTEPELSQLSNRSLIKYKLLVDAACGWEEFQRRLAILDNLATKYHCDIASIAVAALLQGGQIDAAIIGLSPENFFIQNRSLMKLPQMEAQDLQEISTWECYLRGDAYDEERIKSSPHAKVMKYNLNCQ